MINEEVSKYHDLQIITEKIKRRGFYDQILEVLMTMFKEECVFTYSELEKILRQQQDEGSIFEQFWINTEVFRSNLILILTSMGTFRLTVVNSIWRSEDLVKQMLEEGCFSVENRPSDPTSSVRPAEARKEFNMAFNEREVKARNGAKNQAGGGNLGPRGQTTISVVKPEEYSGKEYDFLASKNARGNRSNIDVHQAELDYKNPFSKSGKKSQPKLTPSIKKAEVQDTPAFQNYYDSSRGVNKYLKGTEDAPSRGRSRSFDRSAGKRPLSANRDRSRDYASVYSHYSSIYSRILNATEANKIRKLVGEYNADLDVGIINVRASF